MAQFWAINDTNVCFEVCDETCYFEVASWLV